MKTQTITNIAMAILATVIIIGFVLIAFAVATGKLHATAYLQ